MTSDITNYLRRGEGEHQTSWNVSLPTALRERMRKHRRFDWRGWLIDQLQATCDRLDSHEQVNAEARERFNA
jgi:hypothetical protein